MACDRQYQKKPVVGVTSKPQTPTRATHTVNQEKEQLGAIGNREMGRLRETQRQNHQSRLNPNNQGEMQQLGGMPVSQGRIQRQPLFRGLSEEMRLENATLALPESGAAVQRKLTLGTVGDVYEQEADQVARQVVDEIHSSPFRASDTTLVGERIADDGEPGRVQREAMQVEQEERGRRRKENKSGLPDHLKEGIENLSGISFDEVKVHYNSEKPAQLQALAYTLGTDIYVGTGQEKHLPHEAWHVVQQKQGRVKPDRKIKGLPINNQAELEREAEVLGDLANRSSKAHGKKLEEKRSEKGGSEEEREKGERKRKNMAPVVQRQVYGDMVDGRFIRVGVKRDLNEKGIFGEGLKGKAGDHTTAHVVFRHMVITNIEGKTIEEAGTRLQMLYEWIGKLPGMNRERYENLDEEKKKRVRGAEDEAKRLLKGVNDVPSAKGIFNAAQAIINYRNVVPLSAFWEGGVGHGEGPASKKLLNAEEWVMSVVNGEAVEVDREEIHEWIKAVVTLLDTKRIGEEMEEEQDMTEDGCMVEEGKGKTGELETDEEKIINQHLSTVEHAYENLWYFYLQNERELVVSQIWEAIAYGMDEEYLPGKR